MYAENERTGQAFADRRWGLSYVAADHWLGVKFFSFFVSLNDVQSRSVSASRLYICDSFGVIYTHYRLEHIQMATQLVRHRKVC